MKTAFERTCTIVWVVMLVLTVVSGLLSEGIPSSLGLSQSATVITLLGIAFFKVRLVIIHFMEIGHAALPLRLVLEAWIILTFSVLLFLYFLPSSVIE